MVGRREVLPRAAATRTAWWRTSPRAWTALRGPPAGGPRGMAPRPAPRGPRRGPAITAGSTPPGKPSGQAVRQPPDAPVFGQLIVKVVKGVDLKSGQTMFGKADPYAKDWATRVSTKPGLGVVRISLGYGTQL